IHVDIGMKGETRQLIKEVVGMITSSGYSAKIKPESFGASKVADKHSK
ncbi:MAG TPA: ribonuclease H-like YkuK family protein, partial [bacterium]|nr:ribonuclease H-like YkuK family protein [bacterium]